MVKIELNEDTQKIFDVRKGGTEAFNLLLILLSTIALIGICVVESNFPTIEKYYLDIILTVVVIIVFFVIMSLMFVPEIMTYFQEKNFNKKEFEKLGMTYKRKDSRHWYATKDGENFVSKHYNGVLYIGTKEEIDSVTAYKTIVTFWSARSGDKTLPTDVTEETTKFCDALDYMGSFFRVRTENHIYLIDCLRGEWQLESTLK